MQENIEIIPQETAEDFLKNRPRLWQLYSSLNILNRKELPQTAKQICQVPNLWVAKDRHFTNSQKLYKLEVKKYPNKLPITNIYILGYADIQYSNQEIIEKLYPHK